MNKNKSIQKLFEEKPLIICLLSIFFILFSLIHFDREIALPRIQNQQITNFSAGDKILHIPAIYLGKTTRGAPLIKDLYGSILSMDQAPCFPENTYILVSGQIGKKREIIVDEILVFPNYFWKFFVSILALLLLAIKLLNNLRLTMRGLELKIKVNTNLD